MTVLRLVSWKEGEGRTRAQDLERLGHQVVFHLLDPGGLLRVLKEDPPSAVIIDLSRSPANGRDLGVALRVQATTRGIPLVFVGGHPDKVGRIREILPDAGFTEWDQVGEALEKALTDPPGNPVVPDSFLAGYSGTPLPTKLGIKPSSRVLLAGAPDDFGATAGLLPSGAELVRRYDGRVDLILWFVRSQKELEKGIEKWVPRVGKGGIWIIWPKRSSGVSSDLRQNVVRQTGLNRGLVDYKIAAIDQTWSGLKFAVRK